MFADNAKQANDKATATPPDATMQEMKNLFESPEFYKAPPAEQAAAETPEIEVEVTPADGSKEGQVFTVNDRRFWAEETADGSPADNTEGDATNPDAAQATDDTHKRNMLPTFVEELVKKLAEKEELLQKYIANYKREVAEMEAFKERSRRDQERKVRQEKANFVVQLLDFVDNMDRSLSGTITEANYKDFFVGLQMSYGQLLGVLASEGITKLDVLGKPFNPAQAEALDIIPLNDATQDDLVLQELQPGYLFKDTVLRAAKVKVGKFIPSTS